jgi:hypothetical protein
VAPADIDALERLVEQGAACQRPITTFCWLPPERGSSESGALALRVLLNFRLPL